MRKTIEKKCDCCNNWVGFNMYNEEDYTALCEVIENYETDLRWRHAAENKDNENYFMKKMKKAINKNILCYDADANPGQFTGRLVRIMASCVDSNKTIYKNGVLRTLYVPSAVAGEDLIYSSEVDENDSLLTTIRKDYLVYRGIEIVKYFGLDYLEGNKETTSTHLKTGKVTKYTRRNLFDYFQALGGSLASGDHALVLGVCDNGEPIVGSF